MLRCRYISWMVITFVHHAKENESRPLHTLMIYEVFQLSPRATKYRYIYKFAAHYSLPQRQMLAEQVGTNLHSFQVLYDYIVILIILTCNT